MISLPERRAEESLGRRRIDAASVEASLELPPEEPITGKLVDIEGQPAAGVRLRFLTVMKPTSDGRHAANGLVLTYRRRVPLPGRKMLLRTQTGDSHCTAFPPSMALR